jgi:hypothetical protein
MWSPDPQGANGEPHAPNHNMAALVLVGLLTDPLDVRRV